ncbi:hypothetical protein V8E53_015744 [Lactarius tabidus]
MCPRRGRDGKKLLGVAGGKRKRFWCFKPDQEMGERTAGRKEPARSAEIQPTKIQRATKAQLKKPLFPLALPPGPQRDPFQPLPSTHSAMRRKGLRAEIVVSARIRLFAGTNEVFDRVLQLVRLTFPRMVAIESGEIEEA